MSLGGAGRVPLWIVLTGALSLLLATGTAAAQDSGSSIDVLGDGPLEIQAEQDKDTVEAAITVFNKAAEPVEVDVTFEAAAEETSVEVEEFKPTTVEGRDAERIELTLSGLSSLEEELSGELVVDAPNTAAARSATVSPAPQPSGAWVELIIYGSLAFAIAMFLFVWVLMPDRGFLKKRAPGQDWSFGDSWATTLTAVGALLGAVLGDVTLSEATSEVEKETLVRLNVLFGAVIVIAPFVFTAVRPPNLSEADEKDGLTGFNGVLLLSTSLVFGAVTGELATLVLLCSEIFGGGGADFVAAVVVIAILWCLALYYFVVTTRKLVSTDWEAKRPPAAKGAGASIAAAEVRAERMRVPMP